MVERCPWSAITNLDRGEEDSMEVHIVFAHELVESDVLVIEPPLLPLRCVVCGNARVPYTCLELALWSEIA